MAEKPHLWPQTRGRRGNGGRRADLDNRYFRSAWEANYARFLNWQKQRGMIKDWAFEGGDVFEFPVKRGSRSYVPDFKVWSPDGGFHYVEVKGYMDQRSATKLRRMRKYYPDVRIELVDATAYHRLVRTFASVIPHWEARRSARS